MAFSHSFVETCLSIRVSLAISTTRWPRYKAAKPRLLLEGVEK